jgi:hypothetical protein
MSEAVQEQISLDTLEKETGLSRHTILPAGESAYIRDRFNVFGSPLGPFALTNSNQTLDECNDDVIPLEQFTDWVAVISESADNRALR